MRNISFRLNKFAVIVQFTSKKAKHEHIVGPVIHCFNEQLTKFSIDTIIL